MGREEPVSRGYCDMIDRYMCVMRSEVAFLMCSQIVVMIVFVI